MNFGKQFIVGFQGTQLTETVSQKLKKLEPAGIIFFDTNIESKEQVKKLISDLKKLLGEKLIISVDQEGGKVQRLRKITSPLTSLEALGRYSSLEGEKQNLPFLRQPIIDHAALLATELKELGFNLVFSPCADLNSNPQNPIIGQRSLGQDHKIISEQIKLIIESYQQIGIGSCAKHFPGHGDTNKDTHLDFAMVERTVEENLRHLYPFIQAISSGVDAVMVAHIISRIDHFNNLEARAIKASDINPEELEALDLKDLDELKDSELPASINKKTITEELRNSFAFDGLIISDEITMKALSNYGNYFELAKKMLGAGNDLIIWNTNLDDALEVAQALNHDQEGKQSLIKHQQDSLRRLNDFFTKLEKNKQGHLDYDSSSMFNIATGSIELIKPIENKIDKFQKEGFKVVINSHPKLEKGILEKVFQEEVFLVENLGELAGNIVLIEFQINQDDLALLKSKVKTENLIFCSSDFNRVETEIDMHGSGEIHFKALSSFIENNSC